MGDGKETNEINEAVLWEEDSPQEQGLVAVLQHAWLQWLQGLAVSRGEPWKVLGNSLEQKSWGGVKEHDWGELFSLCCKLPCPTLSSCGFSTFTSWYYGFRIEKYLADLRDQAKSNISGIIPEPLGKATGDQLALPYSVLGTIVPV